MYRSLLLLFLLISLVTCQTLVISTGLASVDHFKRAIDEPFYFLEANTYSHVDFSRYNKVFIALSGSTLSSSDADLLHAFVKNGGHLVIFGASNSSSFLSSIRSLITFTSTKWSSPLTVAHQYVHDPFCPLNNNLLPESHIYSSQVRLFGAIGDPDARVCQRSTQEGVPTAITKSLGLGHLVWIPLSAQDFYYEYECDWNYFKTLVQNSLRISKKDSYPIRSPVLLLFAQNSNFNSSIGFEKFIAQYYSSPNSYDVLHSTAFSTVPFIQYNHVILYMNGSYDVYDTSFIHLRLAVEQGVKLTVFGGLFSWSTSVKALAESGLLVMNFDSYSYTCTQQSEFTVFYQRESHALVKGIPYTFELQSKELNCYSFQVNDPTALVLLRNSENIPVVATKMIGKGHVTYLSFTFSEINSTQDFHYVSRLVENAFELSHHQVNPFPPKVLLLKLTVDPTSTLYSPVENLLAYMSINYNSITNTLYYHHSLIDISAYDTIIIASPTTRTDLSSSSMEAIPKWISEQGKRVILFGSSESSTDKGYWSKLMAFRAKSGCHNRITEDFDVVVNDRNDYLTRNIPPKYSFFNQKCTLSCMDVVDPLATTPIRRQDGYGSPFIAAKSIGKGVFVYIDLPTSCAVPSDFKFLSSLLTNALTITPDFAKRTGIPSLAVLVIDTDTAVGVYDYKLVQAALQSKSIKFDLLNAEPINYNHLSYYSEVIVLYNKTYSNTWVIDKLLKDGVKVFFMGSSEYDAYFTEDFNKIQHLSSVKTYTPSKPHYKVYQRNHVLAQNIPANISFSFSPVSSLVASSYDSVVVGVNGDNLPLLTCKTTQEWHNSTLTTFLTSGAKLDKIDVSDLQFMTVLFSNWFKLTSKDCQMAPAKQHLVHFIDILPKNSPQLLETIQSALLGSPLFQAPPVFDIFHNQQMNYDPSSYSSILFVIGGDRRFPTDFFAPLNDSLSMSRQRVFISGVADDYSFATAFSNFLVNISRVSPTLYPNPALKITTPNHPMVKYFPPVVMGSESKSNLRFRCALVKDESGINVLAKSSEDLPVLMEKNYDQSKLIYFTSPFSNWASEDYYYRDLLIYNFYRNIL
ncbi:hypothetical protein RCL1_005652 [Eukaryota sp. TZLM3-RCL]